MGTGDPNQMNAISCTTANESRPCATAECSETVYGGTALFAPSEEHNNTDPTTPFVNCILPPQLLMFSLIPAFLKRGNGIQEHDCGWD